MTKDRLLAFSDGVIAIIITIMVLELHAPEAATFAALAALAPKALSYLLSFVYVAIYWNNHHHMMATVERVNGAILWANMGLLFCLSLIPFSTAWLGETGGASAPTALYGLSLLAPAIAYVVLQTLLVRVHGADHTLARALGGDWKGKLSPAFYFSGIVTAFWLPPLSWALYVIVALIWLVPDRRIERMYAPKL